jgi:RNA polymerase sigma-70 factor (ECF subfamily)
MNEEDRHSLFTELMGRYQGQLYAYIFAVVKDREDTEDIFQSVCLVLWRKFELFQVGSDFFSWARQTAKLVISNFLRHKKRKSLPTYVNEELLDALTETVSRTHCEGAELYLTALQHCKGKLSVPDEELLELRYSESLGSIGIANRLHRPQQSVCQSLKRIRRWLLECIQMELARQSHSRWEDVNAGCRICRRRPLQFGGNRDGRRKGLRDLSSACSIAKTAILWRNRRGVLVEGHSIGGILRQGIARGIDSVYQTSVRSRKTVPDKNATVGHNDYRLG